MNMKEQWQADVAAGKTTDSFAAWRENQPFHVVEFSTFATATISEAWQLILSETEWEEYQRADEAGEGGDFLMEHLEKGDSEVAFVDQWVVGQERDREFNGAISED